MGFKTKPAMVVESDVRLRGRDDPSEASKVALIDAKSMANYRKEFQNLRLQNRQETEAEILLRVKEYIKRRIDGIVDEACKKRIMDLTTVTLAVASSTVIPFSGVAVVVAATVMQCLNFSITLGLIPLLNVRSFSDLTSMSSQIGNSMKRASKSSLMAGVETAVLEILKKLGLGDWLWAEILKNILVDMIGDSAMDAAWIMTPLLAVPKYMLHRHLIKKMYRKLGDKAHVVHHTWTEQNCMNVEAQTTVVAQEQVDAYGNVQGTYIQAQEVAATQAGARVSQTNMYFQPQNGGAGMAQVSQTNTYFQPENGAGELQVSQTNADIKQQNGDTGEAQESQTNVSYQSENGGAGQSQVSEANAYCRHQSGGAGEVEVSQTNSYFQSPFQPPYGGNGQAEVSQTSAYMKQQSGGAVSQVSQPNAYCQQQAPSQTPWQPSSQPHTNPAADMVPGYQQGPPIQPASNSNLPARNSTLIMGHKAPPNSSYFQPQAQAGGGFFQAAAAAQSYTPTPNPTYFQQPSGTQQTRPVYSQPRGNPYVQMGDYNEPQASSTPGQPQFSPHVHMGDYKWTQAAPASSTPGNPQFSPYVHMGDYNKVQVPMAYPQAGNAEPNAGYQASAPPADLWYQRQAN